MSWLDSYRQASFRGVEFFVESHDAKFGRRQVTHEFPQRDEPYTEDLGRKARQFSVEGYLLGDDYPAQKQRMIAASETEGPGELVHPYLGNMRVECLGLSVREEVRDGRMCRLQLTFIEAGQAKFPSNVADPVRSVTSAAGALTGSASTGFLGRFLTNGFPSFVVDAAASQVNGFSALMQKLPINPTGEAQVVASFFDRVRSLASNALQLVTAPSSLVSEITGIIGSVRDVFGDRADTALRAIRSAYETPYGGATNTPNRRQQQANQDAMSAVIRRATICEQSKVAVVQAEESVAAIAAARGDTATTPATGLFQTRDDAIAVRDELTDALDVEMEDPATSTSEYQDMARLRSELVRGVPSRELRLPSIASVTPPSTLPSVVLAYQVYEDAGRSIEIAERNRVRHPGFLPGGDPLQVITDG